MSNANPPETPVGDHPEHPQDTSKRSTVLSAPPGLFALRVRGDSMVGQGSTESFPEGSIITVDPNLDPQSGDYVIVQLPNAPERVFRVLERDGLSSYLKPLNPRYPIVPMPDNAVIIGVVVSVNMKITPRSRLNPRAA